MDTVRTLFIDSAHAAESGNRYKLNIVGGISVPEGARTYVDNVSFTNTFSEEVGDITDELYVQTHINDTMLDPTGKTFNWSWSGAPKDHLVAGSWTLWQKFRTCDLASVAWTGGGAFSMTAVAGKPNCFTFTYPVTGGAGFVHIRDIHYTVSYTHLTLPTNREV